MNTTAVFPFEYFGLSGASIIGQDHQRRLRNNQDGLALYSSPSVLVGVVTDGCSSGRSSEVGALLGARWIARWLVKQAAEIHCLTRNELLERFVEHGIQHFTELAKIIGGSAEVGSDTVQEFFLFTFLALVAVEGRAIVFGQGDGLIVINDKVVLLDSGPDNSPDYFAYRLLNDEAGIGRERELPSVYFDDTIEHIFRIVIATDGILDLLIGTSSEFNSSQFDQARAANPLEQKAALTEYSLSTPLFQILNDSRTSRNVSWLQKRLNLLHQSSNPPHDDTTLVIAQKKGIQR